MTTHLLRSQVIDEIAEVYFWSFRHVMRLDKTSPGSQGEAPFSNAGCEGPSIRRPRRDPDKGGGGPRENARGKVNSHVPFTPLSSLTSCHSTAQYNRLIDLEEHYRLWGKHRHDGYLDLHEVSTNVCGQLRQVIEAHDRNCLSKKMPSSLFVERPLPGSLRR